MAYIEGQTLRERIRTGPLPEDTSLEIAIQVADGLEEAHKKGIIHRDIKPANVMITPKGRIKIMDFGLAKLSGARATREGVVMGTLAYMSPEQARGEPADHRSDIWSLGAVIYEMITGSLPFPGDKDALIVNGIQNAEAVPLSIRRPGTSPEIEHIAKRALAKNPRERYQGAGEMKADMERLLQILRGRRARSETSADLLTVIPFENLADPDDREREARMISNLVLTALSASGGLRVASEQRLFDGIERDRARGRANDRPDRGCPARPAGGGNEDGRRGIQPARRPGDPHLPDSPRPDRGDHALATGGGRGSFRHGR